MDQKNDYLIKHCHQGQVIDTRSVLGLPIVVELNFLSYSRWKQIAFDLLDLKLIDEIKRRT